MMRAVNFSILKYASFKPDIMSRILSLTLVALYVVLAYALDHIGVIHRMIPIIVLGLACIWYGDALGGMTGFRWFGNINISNTTPGGFLRFLGWILLMVPFLIFLT
jgi:hypothetical protein